MNIITVEMSSRKQKQSLYDIGSLPEQFLKAKFEQTQDANYDPRTVENFMKETIRSTGPDAPIFEQDMPRASMNTLNNSVMSMREHGSRYSHAPFHPELFLGDLTKDPRLTTNDPVVANLADQSRFRQERYVVGKLQDVGDVRTEGIVGEKLLSRQVKQGFSDTATRMNGIFDDSSGTMIMKAHVNANNSIHQVGDTIQEDQKIYQVGDEKILPKYSTDIVGHLSNMIGINWHVQPEAKFKVSSVSNLYRSKQDVDQSAAAVYRLGKQDTGFKVEKSQFTNKVKVQSFEGLKQARQDLQSSAVVLTKDSSKGSWAKKMLPPTHHVSPADIAVGTQSKKEQIRVSSSRQKKPVSGGQQESLVEPIKDMTKQSSIPHSSLPPRDRMSIAYEVKREKFKQNNAENQSKSNAFSFKRYHETLTNRVANVDDRIMKSQFMISNRALGIPNKPTDMVSKAEMTKVKFGGAKEHVVANPTGSNNMPVVKDMNDFEFDTDPTMNNEYQTRSGVIQRMTRLSSKQEYDNDISPLNDTITPYRTNYTK